MVCGGFLNSLQRVYDNSFCYFKKVYRELWPYGRLYKMAGPISVTAFYCANNMRLQQR